MKMVLDKKPKRIWNLNGLYIGETLTGIPKAEYWENKNRNKFIKLGLDYGHATCYIYFLIFDFPEQKILNSKYYNSFELVKFYRQTNNIPVDENISQLHDINWQTIIDYLNELNTLKIQVVSQNINGFKNIRFVSFTKNSLAEEVGFQQWILQVEFLKKWLIKQLFIGINNNLINHKYNYC